jgi:ABC-2 type transport system permease protein
MATHEQPGESTGGAGLRGVQSWLGQARAFAGRYLRELFRNPAVLFWTLGFPVAFYVLTIELFIDFSTIPAAAEGLVKGQTAVSYGMFGAIVASLNSFGEQLAADFENDRYLGYRSLPVAPGADLAGRMAAGLALSVAAFGVVLAASTVTGASYALAGLLSAPVALVALVSFAVVWMSLAVCLASAVRDSRYASIITVSVALGSYFLTGFNGTSPDFFTGPEALLTWLPNTAPTRLVAHHVVAPVAGAEGLAVPGPLFGVVQVSLYGAVAAAVAWLVMRRSAYGGAGG